jgi:glutaredoxin 3
MSIKIEIYTKAYCAYCQRAKELLRIKGVNFVEYDITDDQLRAAEMQQRSQRKSVPGIFINNTPIGDCLDLFDLDERGVLDALLGFAPHPVPSDS